MALVCMFMVALHWYACLLYLAGRMLEADNQDSWLVLWSVRDHPMWARYARAFDRALLTVLADGVNNQKLTNTEVLLSLLGLLAGTAFLAYVTSTVVEVIRGMNQVEEASRRKIIQVVSFMKNAKLPQELQNRVKTHLEHVLLRRRMALDTNELLRELSGPLRAEIALRRCHMLVLNPKMVGMLGSADGRVEPNFIKLLVRPAVNERACRWLSRKLCSPRVTSPLRVTLLPSACFNR